MKFSTVCGQGLVADGQTQEMYRLGDDLQASIRPMARFLLAQNSRDPLILRAHQDARAGLAAARQWTRQRRRGASLQEMVRIGNDLLDACVSMSVIVEEPQHFAIKPPEFSTEEGQQVDLGNRATYYWEDCVVVKQVLADEAAAL